jgi:hypothetical protein
VKSPESTAADRADPLLALALAGLAVLVQLPFLNRPVNYDETNFLVLARGAMLNPWAPHDVPVNWQGTTERAFDVLSNPPGIAWFLAVFAQAFRDGDALPIPALRGAMLLWALPTALGAVWLTGALCSPTERRLRAAALMTVPMAVLSASALLPDAPVYALTLLGMGGFTRALSRSHGVAAWAFIAGSASLFRYSGLCLIPLVLLAGAHYRRIGALWVCAPIAGLLVHDQSAYGQLHLMAMGHFQSVSNTPQDWIHKGASALTFLGGAVALPIFAWESVHLAGAAIGATLAMHYGGSAAMAGVAGVFGALGGAGLASVVRGLTTRNATGAESWLGLWGAGGFGFLLLLRFTAARYWLPFAPAVVLLSPFGGAPLVLAAGALGLGLLADDAQTAEAVADLAEQVAKTRMPGEAGMFTGHWGWQHVLEARGWKALDADDRAPSGALLATPTEAWPQAVDAVCLNVTFEASATPRFSWLPRAYSPAGHANLHANWIAGKPPIRTVIPWTFATDAVETARVCKEP